MLLPMLLILYIDQSSSAIVHVNYARGRETLSCGQATIPCRRLEWAVARAPTGSTIVVHGNQPVDRMIVVKKSLTIKGFKGATLLPRNKWTKYVFELPADSSAIHLSFISLRFKVAGLLYVSRSFKRLGRISLLDCHFNGGKEPFIYSGSQRASLDFQINKSSFSEMSVCPNVDISKCQNVGSSNYLIYIKTPRTSLVVKHCSFNRTGIIDVERVNEFVIIETTFRSLRGVMLTDVRKLTFVDSLFQMKGKVTIKSRARIPPVYNISTCRFIDSRDTFLELKSSNTVLIISSCSFFNCGIRMTGRISGRGHTTLSQCVFSSSNRYDHRLRITATKRFLLRDSVFKEIKSLDGCIGMTGLKDALIQNTLFESNAGVGKASVMNIEKSQVSITDCSFVKNYAKEEGGAINMITSKVEIINSSFIGNKAFRRGGSIYARCNERLLSITHSYFSGSKSGLGGVMELEHCNFVLNNSILIGNSAKSTVGGIRLLSRLDGRISVAIKDSLLVNNSVPVLHISIPEITFSNVSLVATSSSCDHHIHLKGYRISVESIHVDMRYPKSVQSNIVQNVMRVASSHEFIAAGLNLSCSEYFYADIRSTSLKNNSNLDVDVKCSTCGPDNYTLANTLHLDDITEYSRKRLERGCKPCPTGAVCNGYVRTLDEYWGVRDKNNDLTVFPCPSGYCCSSRSTPCVSYNTCQEGRYGTLCGKCKSGYVQSYLNNECIPKGTTTCNLATFVGYFIVVSFVYTFIFTLLPASMDILKEFRSQREHAKDDTVEENDNEEPRIVIVNGTTANEIPVPIAAVVTQVVFFFQLASLVHIDALQRKNTKTSSSQEANHEFNKALFDMFNFRFSVYRKVCPMDNLTLVIKLAINLVLKLSTLINILWIVIVYKCVTFIKCQRKKDCPETSAMYISHEESQQLKNIPSSSDDDLKIPTENIITTGKATSPLAFVSHLKIGFLKLFKLNFTAVTVIFLQLVHCESIHDVRHLYVSADHICYVWWQLLIMVVFLPTLVLFPLSFNCALNMLKERNISTTTFLVSCVIPFASYAKMKIQKAAPLIGSAEEEVCTKKILELEEELFVGESKGVRWSVVQLYRMLLIVLVNTVVLNPVFKSLWFCLIFATFFAHDWYRMPFQHPFLNHLQRLTSASLFLVNLCSTPSAFSSVGNIFLVPSMDICLTVLRYFELCVYAIVLISFPLWMVWEKYRRYRAKGM